MITKTLQRFLYILLLAVALLQGGWVAAQENDNRVSEFSKKKDAQTLALASWNIQHLGRTKTNEEIATMAELLRNFDIVAIQEVVAKDPAGAQKVAQLADELNRKGFQWDYQVSDPTDSSSPYIRERYAFLWKTARVQLMQRAFLDKELAHNIEREPFVAQFKLKKNEAAPFLVATMHARTKKDHPEKEIIHLLKYPERFQTTQLIITGDFNTDEKTAVWDSFYQKGFKSALQNSRTSLKQKCKQDNYLNHAIDNFFYYTGIQKVNAGRLDFVQSCQQLTNARKISDHLPVFMEFKLTNKTQN